MHTLRAVSLFSWYVEQNGRDTQMTTRVTDGARRERLFFLLRLPPSFLASRGFAAQRSRARALPLLNLKKKRYCSQSNSCNVEKRHLYVTDVRLVGPSARKGHFLLGSLSNSVFERRTSTGSGLFAALGCGLVETLR